MSRRVVERPDSDIWTNGTLGPVRPARQLTRRTLLGLTAVVVTGCHKAAKRPPARPNPDAGAIALAREIERNLLSEYDAKISAASAQTRPTLVVQRAIHATHLKALQAEAAAATPIPPSAHGLRADLRSSISALQRLALTAKTGSTAALLASIAASHQVSLG